MKTWLLGVWSALRGRPLVDRAPCQRCATFQADVAAQSAILSSERAAHAELVARFKDEVGFLRGQVRGLQAHLEAPIVEPSDPNRPKPVVTKRQVPWINGLSSSGHFSPVEAAARDRRMKAMDGVGAATFDAGIPRPPTAET